MTPKQLIKTYGWDRAKTACVAAVFHGHMLYVVMPLGYKDMTCNIDVPVADLERLIEKYDLIMESGGMKEAKAAIRQVRKELPYLPADMRELNEAILECEGLV